MTRCPGARMVCVGVLADTQSIRLGLGVWGFASEVVLGKAWWIDDRFALGPGLQAVYAPARSDVDAEDVKFNGFGGGLVLSASFRNSPRTDP
jgi:hypothetical protein